MLSSLVSVVMLFAVYPGGGGLFGRNGGELQKLRSFDTPEHCEAAIEQFKPAFVSDVALVCIEGVVE